MVIIMLKKFSFSLESVLNVRRMKEEKYEKEFSKAIMELEQERNTLKELENRVCEKQLELRMISQNPFSSDKILLFEHFLEHLEQDVEKQVKRIEKVSNDVEIKRLQLIEATKDKKIIDKLKDKEYARHHDEVNRQERTILDEIAVTRYLRDTLHK